MRVWRLVHARHLQQRSDALSTSGARLFAGRWHRRGQAALYAARTPELALLEVLVHLHEAASLDQFMLATLLVPDDAPVDDVQPDDLQDPARCRGIGSQWLDEGNALGLRVPSAVVPLAWNLVLNAAHARFEEVRVEAVLPFPRDPRLVSGDS